MTLEQYKKKLKTHDWYYAWADGYNDFDKGRAQRNELEAMRRSLDPTGELWNEAAPDQFKFRPKAN